jgi:hypothetical protein
MTDLRTEAPRSRPAPPSGTGRTIRRWLVSFAGYPLGGYAAFLLTGRVDGPGPALTGGLVTGAVLGAFQAWAMGPGRIRPLAWILATAIGLTAGVAAGAALVDYRTDLGSLVAQGAVGGALLGMAQAVVLLPRLGPVALVWPLLLSGTFAVGWTVTTFAGIGVDQQFTIFGSSGALVATFLTAILPLVLDSRHATEEVQHRRQETTS